MKRRLYPADQLIGDLEEWHEQLQADLNIKKMICISSCTFHMDSYTSGYLYAQPEPKVTISQFCLDRYEVTNLQYKDFVEASAHRKTAH